MTPTLPPPNPTDELQSDLGEVPLRSGAEGAERYYDEVNNENRISR